MPVTDVQAEGEKVDGGQLPPDVYKDVIVLATAKQEGALGLAAETVFR